MENICLYPAGTGAARRQAWGCLHRAGVPVIDHPSPEITHVLLDVPSFRPDGQLKGGGSLEELLDRLPETAAIIGGGLDRLKNRPYIDLLKDEGYLAKNAALTADCAVRIAGPLLNLSFQDLPVLILGWGRIGKCLGKLLNAMGARVTVAARKETDRAMLRALGCEAVDFGSVPAVLPGIRLLYNTVPQKVLEEDALFSPGCVKIDLASTPGLWGGDVVYARGLPGLHVPESSGELIAHTVLHKLKEGSK